jgi:predicted transcriptional regulator
MIIRRYQKITIVKSARPATTDVNDELRWLGISLGLFNLRDKDKSCFRIFIELLKATKKKKALSSDDLGTKLRLSRGTVVHHLNKLMESGLVVVDKNRYLLRVENLEILIDELRKDLERACDDLKHVAREIDQSLGL